VVESLDGKIQGGEELSFLMRVELAKGMGKCIALEYPNRNKSLPCSLDLEPPGINRLSLEVRRIRREMQYSYGSCMRYRCNEKFLKFSSWRTMPGSQTGNKVIIGNYSALILMRNVS